MRSVINSKMPEYLAQAHRKAAIHFNVWNKAYQNVWETMNIDYDYSYMLFAPMIYWTVGFYWSSFYLCQQITIFKRKKAK